MRLAAYRRQNVPCGQAHCGGLRIALKDPGHVYIGTENEQQFQSSYDAAMVFMR